MNHVERPFLYILVICCFLNTCGVDSEHENIEKDLEDAKNNINYAIHLLEGGKPYEVTELDCSRSTETVIDCRPVE